jgi:hypothetical protein
VQQEYLATNVFLYLILQWPLGKFLSQNFKSLELFECIADGSWSRFGFIWIFTVGPFVGSIGALMLANKFYKKFYDWKVKFDI